MKFLPLVTLLVLFAGCAKTLEKPTEIYKAGPEPSRAEARAAVDTYVSNYGFLAPADVRIRNIEVGAAQRRLSNRSEPEGVYHQYGWPVRFEANAKNRYGAYTGYQQYSFFGLWPRDGEGSFAPR